MSQTANPTRTYFLELTCEECGNQYSRIFESSAIIKHGMILFGTCLHCGENDKYVRVAREVVN